MASRVVEPKSRTLRISNGDWLLVRDRLSAGERNAGYDRIYRRNPDGSYVVLPDGRLAVDPSRLHLATITTYLIDWNLTDPTGGPLAIRHEAVDVVEAALFALDTESYDEIKAAIVAHEAAMVIARAEEKKLRSGAAASSPTSPSPGPAAGPSETSAASTPTSTT